MKPPKIPLPMTWEIWDILHLALYSLESAEAPDDIEEAQWENEGLELAVAWLYRNKPDRERGI